MHVTQGNMNLNWPGNAFKEIELNLNVEVAEAVIEVACLGGRGGPRTNLSYIHKCSKLNKLN